MKQAEIQRETRLEEPKITFKTRNIVVPSEGFRSLAQHQFSPTPYEPSIWEVVGDVVEEREFTSIELQVFCDREGEDDPMFPSFADSPSEFVAGSVWQTPGGDKKQKKGGNETAKENQLDQKWLEEQLAAKYEQGRLVGIQQGKEEAEQTIVESYQALSKRMQEIGEGVKAQLAEHWQRLEQQALQLALGVSQKIVQTAVDVRPEYILEIIRRGLNSLGAAKALKIHVSPQDMEFLDIVGFPQDLSANEIGVQYVADEQIKSGCIIETDFGQVNLELDRMWEEVKDNIFRACV